MIFPDNDTWDMLERAFIGGVVKSNPYYTNILLNNIGSLDLTSDYPSQIIKHLYPMSKFGTCWCLKKGVATRKCYMGKGVIYNDTHQVVHRHLLSPICIP